QMKCTNNFASFIQPIETNHPILLHLFQHRHLYHVPSPVPGHTLVVVVAVALPVAAVAVDHSVEEVAEEHDKNPINYTFFRKLHTNTEFSLLAGLRFLISFLYNKRFPSIYFPPLSLKAY